MLSQPYFSVRAQAFQARVGSRIVNLRGVHDVIREWYFPTYSIPRASRDPDRVGRVADPDAWRGMFRGHRVDQEITAWARSLATPTRPRSLPPDAHDYTRLIVDELGRMGLTPVQPQFAVCSPNARVGTAVDLVATDARGGVVLLEIKTGMVNYFDSAPASCPYLAAPLGHVPNTPRNHALLQLILTRALYRIGRPGHLLETASYVMWASERGLEVVSMPDWADRANEDMRRRMAELKTERVTKERAKAEKRKAVEARKKARAEKKRIKMEKK